MVFLNLRGKIERKLPVETSPAFAGNCIAMAVVCDGLAAKPKVAWRKVSFPTKHRAEHTCEPYGRNNCEIYTRHC
jgi:hypothetical protein